MPAPPDPLPALLDANPWFRALPDALRIRLVATATVRELVPGETLFRRGDPPCGLYAVLAGALSIGAVNADGREALLTVLEPTSWFGEISLFDGQPCTHDAIAVENTRLLHLAQAALQQLLDQEPRYWRHFGLLMASKLRMSFLSVEAIAMMPAAQRLAARLLMIAEGYGGISSGRRHIRLSQERLAALAALTRQTTNQLLGEMAARGIVRVQTGAIEILDLEALRAASGELGRTLRVTGSC